MDKPEELCPYCGGPLTESGICRECGSRGNPNAQIYDPIEGAWQQGRALRRLGRFGKVIAAVFLLEILYLIITSLVEVIQAVRA